MPFNPDLYLQNKKPAGGFDPDAYLAKPAAAPASTPATPEAKPGLVWSDVTSDAELGQIATKHGVDLQVLRDAAAYFGATKQDESASDLIKQAAGFAGEAVGVGMPQKLYKMLQNPQAEAALDDLTELANKKKSYLREAAEIFGGVGTGAASVKLGRMALPAFGAAAGFSSSKAGEELPGAAIGAIAAPILGKAVETAAPLAKKVAAKLAKPAEEAAAGVKPPRELTIAEQFLLKLPDTKAVTKIIDKRLGTDTEQIIDEASESLNKASQFIADDAKHLNAFRQFAKSRGAADDVFEDIAKLPAEVKSAWNQYITAQLSRLQARGAAGANANDLLRKQVVKADTIPAVMQGELTRLERMFKEPDLANITQKQFQEMKPHAEFQNFLRGVELVGGKSVQDAGDFVRELRVLNKADVIKDSDFYARLSKASVVPDFLRSKNPLTAMGDYIQDVNRNLATAPAIAKLRQAAEVADQLGDDFSAKYLRTLAQDASGGRRGTVAAAVNQLGRKWKTHWLQQGKPGIADAPEALSAMKDSLYANALGMTNPVAALQNIATPVLSVLPEAGGAGLSAYMRGLGKVAKQASSPAKLDRMLAEAGITPAHLDPAALAGLQGRGWSRQQIDKFNQFWTSLFNHSERIARTQVYNMGQDLGARLVAEPDWGRKFAANLSSPSYRKTLTQAINAGDSEAAKKQLTRYLNSNHLLSYDKFNQAEAIRFLGPAFSAFTKWPTNVAGRVVSEIYDRGAPRAAVEVTKKLLAPVVLLGVADKYYEEETGEPGKAAKLAPGSSIQSLGRYGVVPPPIRLGKDVVTSIAEGDMDKLRRAIINQGLNYVPFVGAAAQVQKKLEK